MTAPIVVFAVGNPSRGDDAIGPELCARLEKWLARDSGKHHLSQEHKLRLASQLAAHLWRSGKSALPAGELHDWLQSGMCRLRMRFGMQRLHSNRLSEFSGND